MLDPVNQKPTKTARWSSDRYAPIDFARFLAALTGKRTAGWVVRCVGGAVEDVLDAFGSRHQPTGGIRRLGDMSAYVRRLLVGCAAVALVSGCGAGNQRADHSPISTRASAAVPVSDRHLSTTSGQRREQKALLRLQKIIDSRRTSNAVRVHRAYEAASWVAPQRHEIVFWRSSPTGTRWHALAHRSYPNVVAATCRPRITAAALTGASHATYIFEGCFTGDGVLNDEAFSAGRRGWGVLDAGANSLASSGRGGTTRHPDYKAMYRAMSFHAGQLETITGNYSFFPDGEDTRYPLVQRWAWSGRHLTRSYTSEFIAKAASPPPDHTVELAGGPCPRNGTFTASFGARLNQNARYRPNQPLHLLVFPASRAYPAKPTCRVIVKANLPIVVYAVRVRAGTAGSHQVTGRRWITAPAWFLVNDNGFGGRQGVSPSDARVDVSPYVVPASLGVNQTRADIGVPEPYNKEHGWEPRHHPASGSVTFRHGALATLTIATG
jgi:hypothetical protein